MANVLTDAQIKVMEAEIIELDKRRRKLAKGTPTREGLWLLRTKHQEAIAAEHTRREKDYWNEVTAICNRADANMDTPDEFKRAMLHLSNGEGRMEDTHECADGIMCALLKHLGYGEGCDIFLNSGKWYA